MLTRARMALLLAAALSSVGCQAFAPRGLGRAAFSGDEKRIVRQAQNDPFPSPADVGLEEPTAVP